MNQDWLDQYKGVEYLKNKKERDWKFIIGMIVLLAIFAVMGGAFWNEELISEIQIYEERQPNGQWLKSIKFKLPIIAEDMSLSLDNDAHIETVVRLKQNK